MSEDQENPGPVLEHDGTTIKLELKGQCLHCVMVAVGNAYAAAQGKPLNIAEAVARHIEVLADLIALSPHAGQRDQYIELVSEHLPTEVSKAYLQHLADGNFAVEEHTLRN